MKNGGEVTGESGPRGNRFGTELRGYLDTLAREKGFILVFCVSAIISSLVLTYVTSEKYEAATTIYYRPVETTLLRQKGTEAFGSPVPVAQFKIITQTLNDVVKSDVILRQVVQTLRLDRPDRVYQGAWYKRLFSLVKETAKDCAASLWSIMKYGRVIDEDPTVREIATLRKNVVIAAKRESYVFGLAVRYKKPDQAARIVDLMGRYLVDWLREQDQKSVADRLSNLGGKLAAKREEIAGMHAARATLLGKYDVASLPEETARGVENLYALELEQARVGAQIDEKRKKVEELGEEIRKRQKEFSSPEDYKRMKSERLFESIDLTGLKAKQEKMDSSISGLKRKLQLMPVLQKQIGDLEMKISVATHENQQLADLYLEALERASTHQSEIRVLHPALVPQKPVQPIKVFHAGATLFLSAVVAVGLVFLLTFFNVRLFFHSHGVGGRRGGTASAEAKDLTHAV